MVHPVPVMRAKISQTEKIMAAMKARRKRSVNMFNY
jgi:hypothetical protein